MTGEREGQQREKKKQRLAKAEGRRATERTLKQREEA
jgi:hypothetical protein